MCGAGRAGTLAGSAHAPKYLEQFNAEELPDLSRQSLAMGGPGVKVVADAGGAGALREALAGAGPERVEGVAVVPRGATPAAPCDLSELG